LHYIFQAGYKEHGIGVVFKVRKTGEMQLLADATYNPTNTIFKSALDVPREDITGVYIMGRYGLEDITHIFQKAGSGMLKPHKEWTGLFDSSPFGGGGWR